MVAPGGGTGINGAVYSELGQDRRFSVSIVGQSRAHYDCYPEDWDHGCAPPNLQSFAGELLTQGVVDDCDVLVVGSRGGQVVLPNLWAWGAKVPPTVVINGGCAMNLPTPVYWPDTAITFLLLGGQDNFRGDFSHEEYLEDAIGRVPPGNGTTAILYVNEMQHMPQAPLLGAILPHMLLALLRWQESGVPPLHEFRPLLAALNRDGWSGRLLHTRSPGCWEDVAFSPVEVARASRSGPMRGCNSWVPELERGRQADRRPPIELSRKDELKALWQAAAAKALPGGGAPKTHSGAHFAALVQAAVAQAHAPAAPQAAYAQPGAGQRPRPKPLLPISVAGHGDPKALRAGRTPAHQQPHCADPTPISRALALGRPHPFASPASSPTYTSDQYRFFPAEAQAVLAQA